MKKLPIFVLAISITAILVAVFFSNSNYSTRHISGRSIQLNDQKNVTVKVGQRMFYSYSYWGSVGYFADYKISDTEIVKFIEEEKVKEPSAADADIDLPGSDGETLKFFSFQAVKKGIAELTFENKFRGDIEKTEIIRVNVR